MEKVYIAGCGGMLGRAVYNEFKRNNWEIMATDIDINEEWLSYGDVGDYNSMKKQILAFSPDVLVNLAAKTDLEWCEENKEETYRTNALGAENLGFIANILDIPYIYISTAGIFDGKQDYYTEFDIANPLNMYGLTKYYGEQYVLKTVKKHYVFRAGWMMGSGKKDKKFISKITKQIVQGKKELFFVDDKLGTPTYTNDFAHNLYMILNEGAPYGLYNMVCKGEASRYDVGKELVRLMGKENEIKLNIVDSDHFKNEYFAPRPYSEKMKDLKLDYREINFMRDWKVCLNEYVNSVLFKELIQKWN